MDVKKAGMRLSVNADLLTWFGVHGNLILGLRHPENRGPSTRFVKTFARELGRRLVEEGLLTPAELADIEKDIPPDPKPVPT